MTQEPYREREVVREPVREREVIVTDGGGRGSGGVIAAVVGIVLVLLIGYFLLQAVGVLGEAAQDAPTISVPEEVDVNIDAEGGG